jgi:hypothetical protein
MDYKHKYLKYKLKYLQLKQKGGMIGRRDNWGRKKRKWNKEDPPWSLDDEQALALQMLDQVNKAKVQIDEAKAGDELLEGNDKNVSGFRGVYPAGHRWIARLNDGVQEGTQHVGTYDTTVEAARARRDFLKHGVAPDEDHEVAEVAEGEKADEKWRAEVARRRERREEKAARKAEEAEDEQGREENPIDIEKFGFDGVM